LAQFILAKRYARKMIAFLRIRQAEKLERQQKDVKPDTKPNDENPSTPGPIPEKPLLSPQPSSNSLLSNTSTVSKITFPH